MTVPTYERQYGEYRVTTDPACVNADVVESYLRKSYWAANRSRELIERSIEHSLCFSLLQEALHIGFARVVTDFSDFAWLCDVYIDESYRGRGISRLLLESILEHPNLQGLRRFILATRDAHALYAKLGFHSLSNPDIWMER